MSNPRNAGRKTKPKNEKMVRCGGFVTPEIMIWIKENGFSKVREAIEFYRYHHEK